MKKTIAMTCILKNELHNLPRFCESIAGCFDEYHFTDTGSTDGSYAWLMHEAEKHLKCSPDQLHLHTFKWCDNFSAARNHALEYIKTDYWCWLDLDDILFNKDNFIAWKDEAIGFADFWYVPYHYAVDKDQNPLVSFVRERIIKTDTGLKFTDFIHEGVDLRKATRNIETSVVKSFSVKHLRTEDEMKSDKGRNLRILEECKDLLSPRLQFYYGKELFDLQKYDDCIRVLKENVKRADMEQGDRNMAFQYLVHALVLSEKYVEAIQYGVLGIQMEPNRAEFYCMVAESFCKMGEPHKAIPFFSAAKSCINVAAQGLSHEFTFSDGYNFIPRMNLAQIYTNQGRFEDALEELKPIASRDEAKKLIKFCEKAIFDTTIPKDDELTFTDDIVITCPNPNAYPWDEHIYEIKGLGGSETAAVEMAKHLAKQTGRKVIIFQQREQDWVAPSGVQYIQAHKLHDYFRKYKPKLHIAWRHTARFTNTYSVVWSHDLLTPGAENIQNYDHILALSDAHKQMLIGIAGVPAEKIIVTKNGIDPDRFKLRNNVEKQYGKVIFPSSPDRGLEWAIKVMDLVNKEIPESELHVFYSFENMKKFGMKEQAEKLENMFCTRPWIKYHGNVQQTELAKHFMQSQVWLYPSNFFETFAIVALEAMCSNAWPVLRRFGALKDTLKPAIEQNSCDLIDCDMNDQVVPLFAEKVIAAIKEEKYKKMDFNPELFSWSKVASEWVDMFKLK